MTYKQLEKKLLKENQSTFPKIRTNKVFLNEVLKLDSESQKIADTFYDKNNLYLQLPYKSISVKKIVPTQINLTMSNLESVFNIDEKTGAFLVKKDGLFFVIDGHHRIGINILLGSDKIKAYTLDLDI